MPANLENSAVATGLEKVNVSFHSSLKERQCQRMLNYPTVALISHASKVMLEVLQAGLRQYMNHELPGVQAGFTKGRGIRDQIGSSKKQGSCIKTSLTALLTTQSFSLCGSPKTVENS